MTSTQGQSQLTSSSAPAPQEEESLVTRPSNAPPAGKPVLARRGPAGRQVASGGAAAAMPAGGSRTGSSSPATTSSPTTNDAPLTAAKQQEIYDAARQRIFDESHQDDSEQVAASTAASKAVARHAVEHEEAHEYKRDPVVRTRGRGGGGGGGGGSYGPGMGAAPQYPPSSGEFANYYAWQQHQIGRHTGYDASAMPQEHQYYQPPPHHMYGGATEGMYPPHQHHHHHHQHHYPQLDPEYQRYGNDYGGSNNNSRRGRGGGGYNQGGGYNDQVPAYGDYQDPSLGRSNQRGRGLRPGRGGAGAYGGYDDAYGMQAPAPHVALNSRFDPSAPAWEGSGATRSHASHNPGPHVPPAMSQPWTDPRYGGHEHHASRGVGAPRVPPSPAASYPMPPMMRPPNEGQFHVGPPPPAHEMFPELHHKAQAGAAAMAPPHGNPRRNDYPSHDALAPAPRQEPTQPYYQTPGQQPHQQHHAPPPPRHYPQEGQYSAGGGLAGAAPAAMRQPAPTPQQQQQQQQPPLPSLAAPSGGMLSVRVGVAPPVVPFGFQAPPPQHQAPIFQQHQHHGQAIPHEAPPPAPAQGAPAPQPQPTNHTVGPSPLSLAMSRKSLQPTATPAA